MCRRRQRAKHTDSNVSTKQTRRARHTSLVALVSTSSSPKSLLSSSSFASTSNCKYMIHLRRNSDHSSEQAHRIRKKTVRTRSAVAERRTTNRGVGVQVKTGGLTSPPWPAQEQPRPFGQCRSQSKLLSCLESSTLETPRPLAQRRMEK